VIGRRGDKPTQPGVTATKNVEGRIINTKKFPYEADAETSSG
jgi:hypothetical protein